TICRENEHAPPRHKRWRKDLSGQRLTPPLSAGVQNDQGIAARNNRSCLSITPHASRQRLRERGAPDIAAGSRVDSSDNPLGRSNRHDISGRVKLQRKASSAPKTSCPGLPNTEH